MPQGRYERYGLTGNPFRELSSDAVEDPDVYHVNLEIDQTIRSLKEEALEKENRALVALAGPNGVGKTERLRLAQAEAKAREATAVYINIGVKPVGVLPELARQLLPLIKLKGFVQALSPPKFYRELMTLSKQKGPTPSKSLQGVAIAEALNFQAPAFLLINDLHNLDGSPEKEPFLLALQEMADTIKPGVLVMFGSYPKFLTDTLKGRPTLATRINRVLNLPSMARDEAALMLAKKMLGKRLVEQLDPIYPFDEAALDILVKAAEGNPRRVLQMADRAMEAAVNKRAYRIDADLARAIATPPTPSPAPEVKPKEERPRLAPPFGPPKVKAPPLPATLRDE